MRCLITGSKGQLGHDLLKELSERGFTDVLGIDYEELDIVNKEAVLAFVSNYKPEVIFHCAAWTQVDNAEDEDKKELCFKVNVVGSENIKAASELEDAKLIYVSTDYVFDGLKDGLYVEDDQTNPQSVYGKTKLLGEEAVAAWKKHFIVRTSWVFGINGNNFIKTMLRLGETRSELNVVGDQYGSPTYTVDLAKCLVEMALTEKYGTYHVNNEGYCNWAEFATYIFKAANKNVKVMSITTEEYPTKAIRPKNSRLSKEKLAAEGFNLLPRWEDAVDRYLIESSK